jgi:hypothetical protein
MKFGESIVRVRGNEGRFVLCAQHVRRSLATKVFSNRKMRVKLARVGLVLDRRFINRMKLSTAGTAVGNFPLLGEVCR